MPIGTATTDDSKRVVDASVAVKWFVTEQGTEAARELLTAPAMRLIAPDPFLAELANALWTKVHLRRTLSDAESRAAIRRIATEQPVELVGSETLIVRALDLALRLGHPVYDCLYLALAQQERCPLVTGDQRLQAVVKGTDLESLIEPLY